MIFILFSLVSPVKNLCIAKNSYVLDGLRWAKWVAKHVKGKIAIVEGGDLIMMNLPDTSADLVGQYDLYATTSALSIVRPGCFNDFPEAMGWFKKISVTHLAIDNIYIAKRPYLREFFARKRVPSYLKEIYTNSNTNSKWKIRIYYIDWGKYKK